MGAYGVGVQLNAANFRNSHIYLTYLLGFFPADAIGGDTAAEAAKRKILVEFSSGVVVETDIAGRKKFLRCRSETRDFFRRTRAKVGDMVLITRTAKRRYKFELVRR